MTDNPWSLPPSWRWSAFQDVATVASNLVNPADYPDMPHVAPNHIEAQTGRLLPTQTVMEDAVTSAKHRFRAGQVLYSKIRPYLAKVVIAPYEGLCSADMYPIDSGMDARFLKWWMLTPEFTRRAAGQQARTVLPKINKKALGLLPVPVPSRIEQERIGDFIEDQISRIEAGNALIDSSLARSASLHKRILATLPPDDSPNRALGELATASGYGTSTRCVPGGPGVSVVRIPNLQLGRIDLSVEKRAADPNVDLTQLMLQADDLLIVRTNGSRDLIGRAAVVQSGVDASFASYLIRFQFDASIVRVQWVRTMLNMPQTRVRLEGMAASSAGQYNLGLSKLNALTIPCPPLDVQDQILTQQQDREWRHESSTTQTKAIRIRGEALRQALLTAAFTGRLSGRPSDVSTVEEMAGV